MINTKQRQLESIEILRNKISKDPNNPKVAKWKTIIANTERDMANARMTESSSGSLGKLTANARKVMDSPLVDGEQSKIRKEYLHTVIYPDNYQYRVPDELTQPTVLYKSLREFNLIANLDGTPDSGRFSFAVKPILGSAEDVHTMQVGIVNNKVAWPTELSDFSQIGTYVDNNLFSDPRIDPMVAPLTSNPLSYLFTRFVNQSVNAPSISDFFPLIGNTTTDTDFSINGTMLHSTVQLPGNPFNFTYQGANYSATRNGSPAPFIYGFTVSTGTYYYHPQVISIGTWPINVLNELTLWAFTKKFEPVGFLQLTNAGFNAQGVFIGNVRPLYGFDGNIYNINQGLVIEDDCIIRMSDEFVYYPSYTTNGVNANNLTYTMALVSTVDDTLPSITNSGSVIKIRPIGLAALVTCTLPEINAGGNIVAYSAPSSDIDNYYYNTSSQLGPFQNWENLARVNKATLLHDGNFKDGCYVWSQPWDKNDLLMRTPLQMNEYEYQGIIVSGQVNPSVALSGLVNCGRIRISIVYEYTTDNRLFDPQSCIGTTADLDWVLGYLGTQDHASENSDHLKRIKQIAQKAAGLVMKSVPYVIKGASTAGKIAAMFV